MFSYPYLRSAKARFPLGNSKVVEILNAVQRTLSSPIVIAYLGEAA